MDIVIRPVNEEFLEQVVFPAFETGASDARAALDQLWRAVGDAKTRFLIEQLLERHADEPLWNLDEEVWLELADRLLFWSWIRGPEGWATGGEPGGYVGGFHETLHLALMLEDPRYPYWDEDEALEARKALLRAPGREIGFAAMLAGWWDPGPRFPPHQALSTSGGQHGLQQGTRALADWAYRPASAVSFWNRQLHTKLGRLLKREETRLRPLEVPESKDILGYWLGHSTTPPLVPVAFSGLGQKATAWVREIGALAYQIRLTSLNNQGMTSLVTRAQAADGGL